MIAILPPEPGDGFCVWRLDRRVHAATWNSGEGAFRAGGRWNSRGVRAVYTSLDAATAIVEVAVHKGFDELDIEPHTVTRAQLHLQTSLTVVLPADIPNANWLVPGTPTAGQKRFGDDLLAAHGAFLIPSVVSRHSWNMVIDASALPGMVAQVEQEPLAIDPRLASGTG
ncbi:RES family NAD+ phosphorylase [Tropicimonas sp.]|uniref:RES family NAD+ phosphorylase n=1 Tax=Tropicimonas sp. TaxID=2067044 RepID=UPI003A8A391E